MFICLLPRFGFICLHPRPKSSIQYIACATILKEIRNELLFLSDFNGILINKNKRKRKNKKEGPLYALIHRVKELKNIWTGENETK